MIRAFGFYMLLVPSILAAQASRPGSALFFVWQQSRFNSLSTGEFDFSRDFDGLWSAQPENVFVINGTWWIGR